MVWIRRFLDYERSEETVDFKIVFILFFSVNNSLNKNNPLFEEKPFFKN